MSMEALKVPASLMIVGASVLVANVCVLLAMRRLRVLQRATYIFVTHLTITDLLFGVIILGKSVLLLAGSLSRDVCAVMLSMCLGLLGASSTDIMFLYLELFLAVKHMTLFTHPFTRGHAAFMLALSSLIWTTAMGIGLISQQGDSEQWQYDPKRCEIRWVFTTSYLAVIVCAFLVFFAFTVYFLIGALLIMRKRQRQVYNQGCKPSKCQLPNTGLFLADVSSVSQNTAPGPEPKSAPSSKTSVYSTSCPNIPDTKQSFKQRWLRRKMSMTKLIAVVLVLFALCWYPSVLTTLVYLSLGRGDTVPAAVFNCLWVMIPLHAVANVFIYTAKSREFRKALTDNLCHCGRHPAKSAAVRPVPHS